MILLKRIIKGFINYWPLRLQAIVFLLVFVLLKQTLGYFINDEASSYHAIATLLLKLVYAITGVILSFSVLFLLLPYLSNVFHSFRRPILPDLKPISVNRTAFSIPAFLLPFLGSVSVRLVPFQKASSVLTVFQSTALFPLFMRGELHWKQELVDLYRIQFIIIYHSDFLNLFRLPLKINLKVNLSRWPQSEEVVSRVVPAAVAKSDVFRIEDLKKIDGEYLSYKSFEEGDDIRRIVWNIYARNRELVIRQPEIMNPYASHINFVPLFYSENLSIVPQTIVRFCLSEYKQKIWRLYLELSNGKIEVRYQSALTVDVHYSTDQKGIRDSITEAEWLSIQNDAFHFPKRFPAVMVLSAFASDELLDTVLVHPEITLIYVSLDQFTLRKRPLLEKIFLNDNQSVRTAMDVWSVHPLYRQLQLKEQKRLSSFKNNPQVKVLTNEVDN